MQLITSAKNLFEQIAHSVANPGNRITLSRPYNPRYSIFSLESHLCFTAIKIDPTQITKTQVITAEPFTSDALFQFASKANPHIAEIKAFLTSPTLFTAFGGKPPRERALTLVTYEKNGEERFEIVLETPDDIQKKHADLLRAQTARKHRTPQRPGTQRTLVA